MNTAITSLLLGQASQPPDVPKSPVRVLGIDLGTTNSAVAELIWQPSGLELPVARSIEIEQPTDTGLYTHVLVPSVVAIRGGQVWIGEGAKRMRTHSVLRRNRDIFYECKNDIGSRRTYHLAPEGFRSAAEIGGKVLKFLRHGAEIASDLPVSRVVVTVPASFQLPQRNDTVRSAHLAGIGLQPGDLLDEPVAAFLDYLMLHQSSMLNVLDQPRNLLVFDFGGGTCDVAVFRVRPVNNSIDVSPLSVSRYHRLGGGDIDAVIVHEELIPQLLAQNNIDPLGVDFDERKRHLEPALLGIAESLKIGLCIEIMKLRNFERYSNADKNTIVKTHPGVWPCPCPSYPDLRFRSPQLSARRFEELLQPFLDEDLVYARETEYYLTCSIFAPLQDALERAALRREQIHLCLLVGGSSLIPQVIDSVQGYFPQAQLLTYSDRESAQVAVARGAAYHALALTLFGRGLVRPVAADTISIRVTSGLLELVPRGAPLPYPGPDRFAERSDLVVPASTVVDSLPLRVELVAGDDQRPLLTATWNITGPVNRGDPLLVRFQMDTNQCLQLALTLRDQPNSTPFFCHIENPLTLIVNPNQIRDRIEEEEERLRTGQVPRKEIPATLSSLSNKYFDLGHIDKSIDYLKQALRFKGRPDAALLNLLGIRYGAKRDWTRQEKAYREAFQADPSSGVPLFNLALSQFNRGVSDSAEKTIREALRVEQDPPYLVLLGLILEKQERPSEASAAIQEALQRFGPPRELDDWKLGWLVTAARKASEILLLDAAIKEQQRRKRTGQSQGDDQGGFLPEIAPSLRRL